MSLTQKIMKVLRLIWFLYKHRNDEDIRQVWITLESKYNEYLLYEKGIR